LLLTPNFLWPKHGLTKQDGEFEMNTEQMRHAIMQQAQISGSPVTPDMWFSLIFASDETLRKICRRLGLKA